MLTNRLGLPQPFVDAAGDRRAAKPNSFSATTLLKGATEIILARRHADEIEEDVSDRVWAIFGSAVHKILEQGKETDSQIKEGFIKTDYAGYEITGIFDLYDDATGTVTDYKTAGTIKWQKGEFDDYRMQTLIYCWLLRRAGFDAHRGEIVMILRDWVKSKARHESGYPDCQVQKVTFDFGDADFAHIECFVYAKLSLIEYAETMRDYELQPCKDEERWHRQDTWAVVKDGNKRAYRVLESEEDAGKMLENLKGYHIEFRPGADAKCEDYCAVNRWCPHWKEYVATMNTDEDAQ